MKAAIYTEYGGPEVVLIQEIQKPEVKDNEVLIKIHATTVSSGDARMRRADPFVIRLFNGLKTPKIQILGAEFSGEIESIGKNVTLFKKGDQVFCGTDLQLGAHAEYICLAEDGAIARKPSNMSYEEAATIAFGGITSLFFLRDKGNIQPGQKVLINGASGSLGTFGVQLAKSFGAEVTAVCSSVNIDLVKSLGADHVIDYTKEDVLKGNQTYDIIYDTIGKISFTQSRHLLTEEGVFLAASGGLSDFAYMAWTALFGKKKVKGGISTPSKKDMIFLQKLIEEGEIRSVIDTCYPLDKIADAHRHVDTGHKKGNVVITMG